MKQNRYEYKFVFYEVDIYSILQKILIHPASFNPLFTPRWINNIYYDTVALSSFKENVDGVNTRKKYRLRWYGEDTQPFQNAMVLESKHKENLEGYKVIVTDQDFIKTLLIPLNATVQNRYFRHYYISTDGKFRVTIDEKIEHKSPFNHHWIPEQYKLVVELKFDKTEVDESKWILDHLKFRQSKNSKYASGIELVGALI
ncbi:MAG TPA: VTC domain-containing protein [Saprospiraceae bacterium]|nr:VTC domain-containing protein [Lewinellaceae bacterium]HPK10559.1 VTC domain-containing protein [Saprospiraceae bacterium]